MRLDVLERPVLSLRQQEVEEQETYYTHSTVQEDDTRHTQCMLKVKISLCRNKYHYVAKCSYDTRSTATRSESNLLLG